VTVIDPEREGELVSRIRNGDLDAFAIVYHAYYAGLWRFAVRQSQSSDLANDIVHNVFLAVWTHREHWEPASVKAYLYGAVRHEVLKWIRHEQIVRDTQSAVLDTYSTYGVGIPVERPDEAAEVTDLFERVRRAIETLPERQRAAMLLRWVEGLTTVEIAQALGISHPPAVRLLAKAARTLRKTLGYTEKE
jgi:RNA polymerase sigma-70 factor (ECF subfamily)